MVSEPVDISWLLVCAALVLLMQAGFTALESGLVRSKNSVNVAIKNFANFLVVALSARQAVRDATAGAQREAGRPPALDADAAPPARPAQATPACRGPDCHGNAAA